MFRTSALVISSISLSDSESELDEFVLLLLVAKSMSSWSDGSLTSTGSASNEFFIASLADVADLQCLRTYLG